MRILIAPDSFKDALPAPEVCRAIAAGLRTSHPEATLREFPLADGGEGALEVLAWHMALRVVEIETVDALRRPLRAAYGLTADGRTAVIEMARTAGLELLSAAERNPATTSTLSAAAQRTMRESVLPRHWAGNSSIPAAAQSNQSAVG